MQEGYVFKWRKAWYIKYYFTDIVDGKPVRRQTTKRLAPINDQYRSRKDVQELVDDLLGHQNGNSGVPDSSLTFAEYAEKKFLPHIKEKKKPSTHRFYKVTFQVHLKKRVGDIRMRDFTTGHAQRVLDEARGPKNTELSHQSLLRIKTTMSAVFTHAQQRDVIRNYNPVQGAKAEGSRKKPERYAYTLEEIKYMLQTLPDPARTVAGLAAFTGLREGEIRGLRWGDYNGEELSVQRTVWRTHVGETKNAESEATVPVIPVLRGLLEEHRNQARGRAAKHDFIFCGDKKGFSLNLDNLSRRIIKPAIGDKWHGWHAFRRGLGTNLSELGVDDGVIQTLLRHASVITTRTNYIVVKSKRARAAMDEFAAEVQRVSKSDTGTNLVQGSDRNSAKP